MQPRELHSSALAVALAASVLACSSAYQGPTEPSPVNALAFNRKGSPTDTTAQTPPFDVAAYDERIDDIVQALKAQDRRKILIFVHGGLNQRKKALRRAAQLEELIRTESDYYPLFIVWRSSLRSSYVDHLLHIRQGKYFGVRHPYVLLSPFYLLTDVLRGVGRAPVVWASQLKNVGRGRPGSKTGSSTQATARALEEESPDTYWQWDRSSDDPDCTAGERGAQAGRVGAFLLTLPTKIVSAPFIDALGRSAWEVMERRTLTLFRDDEHRRRGYAPRPAGQPLPASAVCRPAAGGEVFCSPGPSAATGSLSLFLHRLAAALKEDSRASAEPDEAQPWEITLVGHSMGAIVINQIVAHFGDELPIRNLVYLAAADNLRNFEEIAIPHLEAHGEARAYHITLHRKAEVRETNAWDLPPRGSLLVWLDDFLDDPQITEERTAGRINNLLRIAPGPEHDEDVRERIHFKAYGVGSCVRGEHPIRHGAFSRSYRFWKPECWQPANRDGPANDGRSCFVEDGWDSYVPLPMAAPGGE